MEKLSTIQKRNNLNEIFVDPEVGPGNGRHIYFIQREEFPVGQPKQMISIAEIKFQKGARNDPGSVSGVLDGDLLEIVRDRLKAFQAGEYATRENACALTHIEEALMWMNKRAEDRAERNVLGTMKK